MTTEPCDSREPVWTGNRWTICTNYVIFSTYVFSASHINPRIYEWPICMQNQQKTMVRTRPIHEEFSIVLTLDARYFCAPPGPNRQGPRKKILPESVKEEFRKIELLCTEYKGLTERQEIELFQRVQLGKPLSQAEAFRATQGSWQEFAKLYERDFSDVINRKATLYIPRIETDLLQWSNNTVLPDFERFWTVSCRSMNALTQRERTAYRNLRIASNRLNLFAPMQS